MKEMGKYQTELKPWKCQFFLGLSCFGLKTRLDERQEKSEIKKSKKKT